MLTEHEAFQQARRIVSETGQTLFCVVYQPSQPCGGRGGSHSPLRRRNRCPPSVIGYGRHLRPGNRN
jgi:hypothetical protein